MTDHTNTDTNNNRSSLPSSNSSSDNDRSEDELISSVTPTRNRCCKRIDTFINGKRYTMDWDPDSAYSITSPQFLRQIRTPALTQDFDHGFVLRTPIRGGMPNFSRMRALFPGRHFEFAILKKFFHRQLSPTYNVHHLFLIVFEI